jgi:1,4-dihydroxy-2-naphthoate octaprenyltransferase
VDSSSKAYSPPVGEPNPVALGGTSAAARIKRTILGTRPKFFTASVLPVLVGTVWGSRFGGQMDWTAFLLALIATVLVHAASNVWNDVCDEITGTDRINNDRIHPYTGGSRFIQNGVMGSDAMLRLSQGLGVAALVVGAILTWLKGVTVLWLGLAGLAFGYLYSSPGVRLSGRGVGEFAVAVAFGILPVCGAAWLQSGQIDWRTFLLAVPVSCWVADILLINGVPDRGADEASGKRTLPVRLGRSRTAVVYGALQSLALLGVLLLIAEGALPLLALIAPVALVAIGWMASRKITDGSRGALKQGIEVTLGIHAIGCLWLMGWTWFYPLL